MRKVSTHKEVLKRIKAGQKHLSTNEDLSEFGYNRVDKSRNGIQRWILKEAQRTAHAKWYKKNSKRIKAKSAKYCREHLEIVKATRTRYRSGHHKKIQTTCAKWHEKHPEFSAKWYKFHSEDMKAATRKWRIENPEKVKAQKAKRKRQLGYTLLMPLEEGEDGHHVTDECVIGVPADEHKRLSGYKRRKHRTLVLQWLKANDKRKYNLVLCVLAKEPLK